MLNEIKNALVGLGVSVYHYTAKPQTKPPYIVYAEDSENNLIADGTPAEKAVEGSIDLYFKDENNALITSIPQALESIGVAYYLNSVQYEDDTNLIHYEWIFTAV